MALRFERFTAQQENTIGQDWATMVGMAARALGNGAAIGPAMATWFGAADRVRLLNNLRKMNVVVLDANRTFTFVNRAGGVLKVEYHSLLNPQLMPPGSAGNQLVQQDAFGNLGGAVAYAFPANRMDDVANAATLDDLDPLPLSSHVGSGMRLYLTEIYFTLPDAERAATLYHELTHKVLACEDYAYGIDGLNLTDADKLRNADNYGMFVQAI